MTESKKKTSASKTKNEMVEKKDGMIMDPNAAPSRGFEEDSFDNDDLIIPRAKLIQALSPEMSDDDLEGIKQGMIINSLSKEQLPDEFIPIFSFKNFIRFNAKTPDAPGYDPEFEPGAIIWKSNDHRDPKVVAECGFGPNGEKPLAVTFMNFFSYFPGVPMPIIVSFSKTSYKAGKQLFSLAKFSGGDMFSRKYKLSSVKETNDIASYFVLKVAGAGLASEDEYTIAERLWQEYSTKKKDIIVHDEEGSVTEEAADPNSRPY